jgi:hypothetical protein
MTIVHDPSLGMESSKSEVGGGTTPFTAPELLVPSKFGMEKCTPTKEADIYAISMVIYQVPAAQCSANTLTKSFRAGAHWDTTVRQTYRV